MLEWTNASHVRNVLLQIPMSYHLFRRVLDIGDPFIVQKIFNSWSITRVLHETLSYEIFGLGRAKRYQIEFGRLIQNLVF